MYTACVDMRECIYTLYIYTFTFLYMYVYTHTHIYCLASLKSPQIWLLSLSSNEARLSSSSLP